jgi:hypothetical protein
MGVEHDVPETPSSCPFCMICLSTPCTAMSGIPLPDLLNSPALVVPSAARYVAMLAVWYEGAATIRTTGYSRVINMRVVQRVSIRYPTTLWSLYLHLLFPLHSHEFSYTITMCTLRYDIFYLT